MTKRILFISGTRADFGKIKPLIKSVQDSDAFKYGVFVTGMHLMSRYGLTVNEIKKSGFDQIHTYINQIPGEDMESILANTITGLSRYLHEHQYDLIVVHGDRVEALAGATVGALRNILVAHIEGGEVSGTIDELMRHAITKMSHIHFVGSDTARKRLVQLGENPTSIFTIGSPDIDVMLSDSLPDINDAKKRYDIQFDNFSIAMLHPVTTLPELQAQHANIFVDSLIKSDLNYIVIYPNNDAGSENILQAYKRLEGRANFRVFPSLRFEYFLALLKKSKFIIGNSSAGIHEAPVYSVPTVNVGERQHNRIKHSSVYNVDFKEVDILEAISSLPATKNSPPLFHYGNGDSAAKFMEALGDDGLWTRSRQKYFQDIEFDNDKR
ncbi:UDP-N-acetylglucosamine 2-epimerase (hydrolysing) [Halopseudomonas litoralis]|uniref:UDP-N-acetylglucosamine 2-epimerase (Hydrolysing) n=1 Tax=Halopseudomonas litoralis TaxID=797277 RepID=A0A1H1U3F7_9GAMM|nr:UDP-N-acetylglucosamine 2-epimerase [Halopseudomonas litoralis]SDS66873.1 UDP-N-acetylglucosamine 2-epimerase (hydrolysing) [Halopseudomonas litoralis]